MSHPSAAETVHDTLVQTFSELDQWFERPWSALQSPPEYPGAWSDAEHLEHVSLANHFLLLTIGKGCSQALRRAGRVPIPEAESDLVRLQVIAEPGVFEWQPPPHMVPTGGRPPAEVRAALRGQCVRCLELLAGMPRGEGRLCTIWMSVNRLGRLDMYQWLYFLAQHGRYHLALLRQRQKQKC